MSRNVEIDPVEDATEQTLRDEPSGFAMDVPPPESASDTPQASRSSAWIAWSLVVSLAIVAGFAGWQAVRLAGVADDERAARTAAASYVSTLSSWDASDGLEDTYELLRNGATNAFLTELDEVFGVQTRSELVAIDAISTGTVQDVLVGDVVPGDGETPDTATVVVLVEQLIVTGPNADPVSRVERAALVTMLRDGERWLVDDLEMLSELELIDEEAA